MSSAASTLPCKLLGVPLVDGTIRSGRPPERWTWAKRRLLISADAVIANSRAGLDSFGLERPGLFVVHNGFDAERMPTTTSVRSAPAEGATAQVIMAARMTREKDFDTLIDAVESLHRAGAAIRLALVGSGSERERLTKRCRELTGAGIVELVDGVLEVMPLLATADIGVLLTDPRYHAEGISNSIMEYMARGLPVVCTDSGGNREIVSHGRTGLLVPAHDAAAVVSALRLFLEEPETARRFGEAGRDRIRTDFSTQAMVAKTIRVYESVLRDRGPAPFPPGTQPPIAP
jgi:glycosyltransferase involved in cell wall biosynthesis